MARKKGKASLPPAFRANIEKMKQGKLGKGRKKKSSTASTTAKRSTSKRTPAKKSTSKRTTRRKK
jgi:topoisomerase IA-like protein